MNALFHARIPRCPQSRGARFVSVSQSTQPAATRMDSPSAVNTQGGGGVMQPGSRSGGFWPAVSTQRSCGSACGSSGGVPHETDDIADILDVSLLKGLGELCWRWTISEAFSSYLSTVITYFKNSKCALYMLAVRALCARQNVVVGCAVSDIAQMPDTAWVLHTAGRPKAIISALFLGIVGRGLLHKSTAGRQWTLKQLASFVPGPAAGRRRSRVPEKRKTASQQSLCEINDKS